ncbi:related to cellulose binding protein CEL1 [Rhynchosporium secalis]|uniref:lytic cellulose monooxygenase (C4-dehydrogenating) n=1 Tax=Rhynchosporium secalis TaxID=38038 RepID=A0A1E1MR07_RHYSE|nr:related to cellulose binding protein CEL1 [Rhynchosporium secalis]
MKLLATITTLTSVASAHYVFPSLISAGATTEEWANVRQWTGYYTNGPVTDVSLLDIRCNVDGSTKSAKTLAVTAGSVLGFTAKSGITHPGVMQFYMAKVPQGKTAATWDGSGSVWFKVFNDKPTLGSSMTWPTDGKASASFTIPKAVPNGEYLVRAEHIALHSAGSTGGAQFYISCAQVSVTGGGSGTPGPLVAFPGAYKPTDPGILINVYYPVPTSYTPPGPAVWTG